MKSNIVLCGFMGCGKSTIGRALAEKLNMRLIDTDAYIEKKEGMKISEIFSSKGEEYFRNAELEACRELADIKNCIISTGGGTLLKDENVTEIKKGGTVFFLNISPQTVLMRLRHDTTRPLLQRKDKEKAVNELMDQRMPLYRKAADYIVSAEEPPRKVCAKIISIYNGGKNV